MHTWRREAYHDNRAAEHAALTTKIQMTVERNTIMGCLCNLFDNEEVFWIIVIILLLLILNCTCCN